MASEAREWLIRKNGYYYRPNRQGYTTRKHEAGRYTLAEADREVAVEPGHMTAVHQDAIPDEPVMTDHEATIATLRAERDERHALYAEQCELSGKLQRRAEAAEASLTEVRKMLGDGWAWMPYPTEDDEPLFDVLVIGKVQRFYDDAPTYAEALGKRLGAFATDTAAREAVARIALARLDTEKK